jgi:nucleotide-binding universal stress UspA family protein
MPLNVKSILVAVKGNKAGEDAFRMACGLSKGSKAKLRALYVMEVRQELHLDAEVDATLGETILGRIEALGQEEKRPVEAQYLQARRAGPAIVQEAVEWGIELIVLGIPYKRRFGQFVLGDTASYVLKNAPCPVILWREQVRTTPSIGS